MLILLGESASGKSTIEKILCDKYGYKKVISYTTRSPREGEVDGVDYHFISKQEFFQKQRMGFFAEIGKYNGWLYGSAVEDCTNDKVAVLTPHGMRQLKKRSDIDLVCIYIQVPRRDRFIKILQRNDDIEEAKRRDASDVGQFDGIEDEVDYIITNDSYKSTPDEMAICVDYFYEQILESKKSNILTILCDIDEVINNLVTKVIEAYNEKYQDNVCIEDVVKYNLDEFLKPECENVFKEFCTDELLASLQVQPKAKDVIKRLMKKHKFYFVSSTYPDHVAAKDKWLQSNFDGYSSKQLIICQNKQLIHGDILIDDCMENFITNINCLNAPVKYNLIFDRPWNRTGKEDGKKTFRVHDWAEIERFIDKINGGYKIDSDN